MKKIISILLVIMMVFGMFPATSLTAFAAEETVTISFANGDNLQSTSSTQQVHATADEKVVVTNNKTSGSSKIVDTSNENHARFYKNSTLTIACAGMKTIVVNCTGTSYLFAIEANNDYSVSTDGSTVTVSFPVPVDEYTFTMNTQARVKSMTITYELNACQHEDTVNTNVVEPDCVNDGSHDVYCNDCEQTITVNVVDKALGHNYEDGVCTECGEEQPDGYTLVTDVSALNAGDNILIVAKDFDFAMSTEQKTSNRGQAAITKTDNIVTFEGDAVQILTLQAGATANTFSFYTGEGYLYASSSSSNQLKTETALSANSSWAIEIADGVATIVAQGTNTRNVMQYNSTSSLFACYASTSQRALCLYVRPSSEGDVLPCEHPTSTEQDDAVAATCTSTGWTASWKCDSCGVTTTIRTETPMIDHTYTDDACSDCGAVDPNADTQAELMTALPYDGDVIIIYNSGYAMRTDASGSKLAGAATAPVDNMLPYAGSVALLTVGVEDGIYTFAADDKYLTSHENGSGLFFSDNLTDYGKWSIESAGENVWYITNTAAAYTADVYDQMLEYFYGFTTYGFKENNAEKYQMQFYLVEAADQTCYHERTEEAEDGYAAECGKPGKTNSVICSDCGETVTPQKDIPALEHNYIDGACEHCYEVDPIYQIPGRYYIAAMRTGGDYWYMTSDLGTASTRRYTAVAAGDQLPEEISSPAFGYVFVVIRNDDGTFSIQAEGIPEKNYLGWTSGNSGTLVTEGADHSTFTAEFTEDGKLNFHFTGDDERYLSLNGTSGSDYFAWYKGTQKHNLTLIPVTGDVTAPAAEANGKYYATVQEAFAANASVKLLADVESITYDGDLCLDLNGNNVEEITVQGTLKIADSQATVDAPSGAKIGSVTATEIAVDYHDGNARYIALENNGEYTFHVLEMKLSTVTLRTTQAGIYYKAILNCDSILAAAVDTYGVALSVSNMPGADFATEKDSNGDVNGWTEVNAAESPMTSGKAFTSGSVFGIFKEGLDNNAARGEVKIYANAYIKVGNFIIMSDTTNGDTYDTDGFDGVAFSLRDVMKKLDEQFSTLDEDKKTLSLNFYKHETWNTILRTWTELTNLAAAAQNNA